MEEIWKDVVGFEDYYQVSNLGNVRSKDREVNTWHGVILKRGRILKQSIGKNGYYSVCFQVQNKKKSYSVHRMVAQAFIPNLDNMPYINHKDENKLNNNIENLEWCTAKYIINYGTCKERRNQTKRETSNLFKVTMQYNLDGTFVKEWKSTKEIERELGFSNQGVSACCRGIRKSFNGFIWKYKEPIV